MARYRMRVIRYGACAHLGSVSTGFDTVSTHFCGVDDDDDAAEIAELLQGWYGSYLMAHRVIRDPQRDQLYR